MSESKETTDPKVIKHGVTTVTASRAPLTDKNFQFIKGILIRAPGADDPTSNTLCVWVGGPAVTADSATDSGGIPLPPGESITLPVDDPTGVYVISTAGSQEVAWLGV